MSGLQAVLVYRLAGEVEVPIARTGAVAALRTVAKEALGDADDEVAAFERVDDVLAGLARADRDRLVRLLELAALEEVSAPPLRLLERDSAQTKGNED